MKLFLTSLLLISSQLLIRLGQGLQPGFSRPLANLTVALGREATFQCHVHNLGGYRVGWVKADTKAIQAIHDHVITHNHRIAASHFGEIWNLHIRNVQEEDKGTYMCQINTDPMLSQMSNLDVVIPPDFISEETSGDVMVPESGNAKLTCRARGYPEPRIQWRREDGKELNVKHSSGVKEKVHIFEGPILRFVKINRSEMGSYLCIASNGIPPSISKRIIIKVNFHPVIQVPNQLVGSPLGKDVTLECNVEASPKSIAYWQKDTGEMVVESVKYSLDELVLSLFEMRLTLIVKKLSKADLGTYRCVAKNSLGEADSSIRVYELTDTRRGSGQLTAFEDDEDLDGQFGSADLDPDEDPAAGLQPLSPHSTSISPRGLNKKMADNRVAGNAIPSTGAISSPLTSMVLLVVGTTGVAGMIG